MHRHLPVIDAMRNLVDTASQRVRRYACWLLIAGMFAGHASGTALMDHAHADKVFADARVAALATAAGAGDTARVHALVAEGADPNAHGEHGVTPLEWALLQQNPDGLGALLDAGARPEQPGIGGATVLHMAAMANDPTYLRILLDHGADPNAPHGVTGASPLAAALMNARGDAFDLLLAHHADPDRADRLGNTPLHVAAQVHKSAAVLRLLEAGANPALRNRHGDTFQAYFNVLPAGGLNPAAKAQHEQVKQWLRDHGVAVEGPTD